MSRIENILFRVRCNTILGLESRPNCMLTSITTTNMSSWILYIEDHVKTRRKVYQMHLGTHLLLLCLDIYYFIYSFFITFFLSSLNFIFFMLIIKKQTRNKFISLAINICTDKERIKKSKASCEYLKWKEPKEEIKKLPKITFASQELQIQS